MQQIINTNDTIDTFSVYQILRVVGYSKTVSKNIESIAYEIDEDHREYNTPKMSFLTFFRFLDNVKKDCDLTALCDTYELSDFVKSEIKDHMQSVKTVNYSRVFDFFN